MNRTSSEQDFSANACFSRDRLQEYLVGQTDMPTTDDIEAHLTQCRLCEQTLTELEQESDAMLASLREPHQQSIENDPLIVQALEAAKHMQPELDPSMIEPSSSSNPHPTELGPYELLQGLGRGGMGMVYLARHRKLNKKVAIKLLPASFLGSEAQARFDREILAAGQLKHPSIVLATDAGQSGGVQYLVMEYVEGLDLGRLARAASSISIANVCEIGRQIALGLSFAHAAGMVHRDIKPSNVMLDKEGSIKLLDFGLVLLDRWDGVSSELTTIGQFLGTLDYMAPEQAERCGSVDYRADLYSLGATLFRLLCGRAPLAASPNQSPLEKLRLLANHRPPSLKTLCPAAPQELVSLVDQLLSTNPNQRPPSAAHVAEQLGQLAEGADLKSLLNPWPIEPAPSSSIPTHPLLQHSNTPLLQHSPPRPPNKTTNRSWLAAAASLPFLVFAGYMIVLETKKGQLVIDSEVADVQVKILRNGEPLKELSIQTGSTSTRLSADQYEITIQSPSDNISIENNQFILKSGQTQIARISRRESVDTTDIFKPLPAHMNPLLPSPRLRGEGPGVRGKTPEPQTTSETAKPNEGAKPSPLYKGKTYEDWLAQLRLESDHNTWEETFHSIHYLATDNQKKDLAEEVLALAVKHTRLSSPEVCSSLADWTSHVDLAKRLIQIWHDKPSNERMELFGQFVTPIRTLEIPFSSWDPIWSSLEKSILDGDSDPQSTTRLYTRFHSLPNDRIPSSNSKAPEPALVRSGKLIETYRREPSTQRLDQCLHIMTKFPKLGQRYVLYPVCDAIETGRRDRTSVGEKIRAWVEANSAPILAMKLAAISDSSEDVVNRVSFLTFFTNEELESPETRTVFADSVNAMLAVASRDQEKLFGSSQITGRPTAGLSTTQWEAAIASGAGERPTSVSQLLSKDVYAILLLSLERLPSSLRPRSGLDAVIEATKKEHDELRTHLLEQLGVQDLSRAAFTNNGRETTISANQKRFVVPVEEVAALEVYFCHRWASELRGTPTIDTQGEPKKKPLSKYKFPASVEVEPRWVQFSETMVKKMDKDNDSFVSRKEWSVSNGDFDLFDTNNDDKISVEEFYMFRKK